MVTLIRYLESKAAPNPSLAGLSSLLSSGGNGEIGLILSERLVNMPAKVVPPMYTMLLEEVEWAVRDKEPYTFTHYLILSKTYKEIESQLDKEDKRSVKKAKGGPSTQDTFYFHPEDERFHDFAVGFCNFDYTSQNDEGRADSKRTFQDMGIMSQGHMILIERARFEEAVKAVSQYLRDD
jgi:protein BCP1